MKIKISWNNDYSEKVEYPNFELIEWGYIKPTYDFSPLISGFLTDDGGLGVERHLEYLGEDLISIEKIANKELDLYETGSEHWYVDINSKQVIVGWNFVFGDEEFIEEFWSFEDFYNIVKAWYGMMQRRNYDEELIIEL